MRLIDADAAIEAINGMFAPTPTQKDMVGDCIEIINSLPTIQPELGGYPVEYLMFVARLMRSANVTPETLVNTLLKDVEKTVRLVFELVRRQSEDAIIKVIMNGEVTE